MIAKREAGFVAGVLTRETSGKRICKALAPTGVLRAAAQAGKLAETQAQHQVKVNWRRQRIAL